MAWLRDPTWQQGLAILLVVAGTILIYLGASGTDNLNGIALIGVALFGIGVGLPLISQALRAAREDTARNEEV